MKIDRNAFDARRSNWVSGSHDGYTFEAKVFAGDRGPYYGETVPHYADIANEIVAALEAEFCEEA